MTDHLEDFRPDEAIEDRPHAIPAELPVLPLRDTVLFPNSFMPLAVARAAAGDRIQPVPQFAVERIGDDRDQFRLAAAEHQAVPADRPGQRQQVQRRRPVLDVVQIQAHPLLPVDRLAPGHLPQPREARLGEVPAVVGGTADATLSLEPVGSIAVAM